MTTLQDLNSPAWSPENLKTRGAFQEVWYLKLNDPASNRALWLRFTLLLSGNGFRRVAETWGIFFSRGPERDVKKIALKQTFPIQAYSALPGGGIRIGESEFSNDRTRGSIDAKGHSIKWDLGMSQAIPSNFSFVPTALSRSGIVKNSAVTVGDDIRFNGMVSVDGESISFRDAPGMQGHLSGPKNGHSWVWGHCNSFETEQGLASDFLFEGICARARLAGGIPSPRMSAFLFRYKGQEYRFNSLWDALWQKSENTLTTWEFTAERGNLSFRGKAQAEHKDFAGVTYEDTDGSLLYCSNSKLSDMKVHVYRSGKLEASFRANGTAAFEVVSRNRNPYVPLLI